MTLNDLTKIALIGTARAAVPVDVSHGDDNLAAALDAVRIGQTEADLLAAAAVLSAYEACGRVPSAERVTPSEVAEADARPACSRRAADVLRQVLAMTNTPSKAGLIAEWLTAAAGAKRRMPHAMLPALLEFGVTTRTVREAISVVADRRGAWLMAQNARWRFAAPPADDAASLWLTGNREQRASALRRARAADAAAGLALVTSTWKEDAADERAAFVEALAVGLGSDDEPFLEAALDDRSKQVRAAAVEALGRLPTSGLVARMTARLAGLLTLKGDRIDVALPPEPFDTAWARDGVTEKAPAGTGKRQWWLSQALAFVPPSYWSSAWNITPATCVASTKGDHQGLLLSVWTQAAERFRDADWAEALLIGMPAAHRAPYQFALLAHLPPERRSAALTSLLDATTGGPTLTQLFHVLDGPLDEPAARAAVAAVERAVEKHGTGHFWALADMLPPLAQCLPLSFVGMLADRWTGTAWDANRRSLDIFFTILNLRQTIRTEFAT